MGQQYWLQIVNGAPGGTNRVDSLKGKWNGKNIIGASDFNSLTDERERVIAATQKDTLQLQLFGATTAYVTVAVFSVPDPMFNIFGENTYTKTNGSSQTFNATFTRPADAFLPAYVFVVNGDTLGAHRVTGATVKINGTTVVASTDVTTAIGSVVKPATGLHDGLDTVQVILTGSTNALVQVRIAASDSTAPVVTLTAPADSAYTSLTSVPVTGILSDRTALKVTVNGGAATVTGDTSFSGTATLTTDGWHTLTVVATDVPGLQTTKTRAVKRDTQAPSLALTSPTVDLYTQSGTVTVSGTASDANPFRVNTNGTPWTVVSGAFSGSLNLVYGANVLVTTATDTAGNTTIDTRTVTRDTVQPALAVTAPTNGSSTTADSVTVSGTASDANPFTLTVNGIATTVSAGAFSRKVALVVGSNTITTVATDGAGNVRSDVRSVTRTSNLPPDPSTVAPPLPQTVASTIKASTEFLYTGAIPIQTGVAAGTIQPQLAAVIRGKVLDSVGNPLSGVTVSILNHPEFGQTLTRDTTGMFDLAVNGGLPLTVSFTKAGFLKVQRTVQVPWQDYITLDSVAILSAGSVAGTVDFTQPLQVIRADSTHDASGGRRPTLMFRDSTVVTAILPDGSSQVITGPVSVRVQEATVGELGAARMPAELPATSAYTYAVALNLDTALALGTSQVTFSKPVAIHVDNFLGVPVGSDVPVGYYDVKAGRWVAQPDGRIIKILSVTAGLADLATDTAGAQATPAQLAALGIDTLEQARLAATYPVGKTLSRITTTHFSWLDLNYGESLPADAIPPNGGRPTPDYRCPNEGCELGSRITAESQVLGEAVPITGTPFSLYYQSDRVPGYGPAFGIDIPLRGDTIPPSVDSIGVVIEIAGRRITAAYGRSVFRTKFIWDGKDAYGRYVQGRQPYKIGIGFRYQTRYSVRGGGGGAGGGSFGGYAPQWVVVNGRRWIALLTEWRGMIGPWNAIPLGLGGWTLSAHHAYDPTSGTLHLGTGGRRQAVSIGNTVVQVAGTGATGSTGDNGPALQATFSNPVDVAVGGDGAIYIADQSNHRIRKIAPDGVITTVAGTGTVGYTGDGAAATQARITSPEAIAVAPDGTLYIAEGSYRVRRVDPVGIITTFAGGATGGYAGDGGLVSTALFNGIRDVAVGPDGSIYIADQGNRRIRRVGTNGYITTVAGNGNNGVTGDGGPALNAPLGTITGIDVGADGSLYIASGFGRIRRVATDGIIDHAVGPTVNTGYGYLEDGHPADSTGVAVPERVAVGPDGTLFVTEGLGIDPKRSMHIVRVTEATGLLSTVAGNGTRACGTVVNGNCKQGDDGDGGLATQAYLYGAHGMAVAPNGDIVFAERNGNQIRKVTSAMPGITAGTMLVASEDGGLVYEFSAAGQHQRTLDALTGATVLTFAYDTLGKLATITDAGANVTTIQRNGLGHPAKIITPFGQQTTLTADPNYGFLTSVANPGGETVRLWYRPTGLLDSLADPRNGLHRFTYDSLGRLSRDDAPDGSFKTLTLAPYYNTKTSADTGFMVTVGTAMGRTRKYAVDFLPSDRTRRTVFDGAGFKTTSIIETGVDSLPDGTVITQTTAGDPRWGMQAARLGSLTMKLPSGLTASLNASRRDSLANAADPLSLVTQVDTVIVSGDTSTSIYSAATRRLVRTSPMGRQVFATVDSLGRVVVAQAAGLDSVRFLYDGRGRLAQEIEGGRTTTYGYHATSGRLSRITDPAGRVSQFSYDSAGRVTAQTLPDGRTIGFGYDANGNLTSLTPPGRPGHGFQYSSADLAIQYDPPGIPGPKPTKYFYNLDRQVDSIVRPDSLKIGFVYDVAGRPSSVSFDRGTLGFGYSATGGSLTSIASPGGDSLKFTYDGAMPTTVTWKGQVNGSVVVGYDNHFRVTSQTVNGANAVGFGYDKDGLLTAAGGLGLRRSATNGLLLADSLNSVKTSYGYISRGELSAMHSARGGTSLLGSGYVRDSLGRIVQLFDTTLGTPKRWSFVYDSVGRLKADSVDGSLFHAFSYDSNGNRLSYLSSAGTVSYVYDSQDRLTSSNGPGGTTTYTYGSNGELRTKTVPGGATTTYTYDALGNLTRVLAPNGAAVDTVEYLIDGQNRRVGRRLNGAVTHRWLYQNQLNPVAELDSAGAVVSRFVYGTRSNVPDYMLKGGSVYRLVTDHLGSVRLVVDTATGAVAQQIDYDEWGVATVVSEAWVQPFGFAGGLEDAATGLVRFGARDYIPALGRWTAKDPIGFAGGNSGLYEYVRSDPVNMVDITGLRAYSACETQRIIDEIRETESWNPVLVALNHNEDAAYDFGNRGPSDTYVVDGRTLSSYSFGNYAAGYGGVMSAGFLGLIGVLIGGIIDDAYYGPFDFDADSRPDILAGAARARRETDLGLPLARHAVPSPRTNAPPSAASVCGC
ncbi:MAG: hypothetical protein KA180_06240 [Gemmatimonadales bacterium]|nr:hypothetical protein [Gemmatimonadales bacterium]